MMGIEFQGFDELEKKLAEAEKKLPGARDKFLMQAGQLLRDKAAELTITRKKHGGTLKAAWRRSPVHGGCVEVYNDTDYAAHVEYGHRVVVMKGPKGHKVKVFTGKFVPGHHMLRDALNEKKERFQEDARDILEEMFS